MTEWPAKRVRDTFVDYFVSKGHKHVVSSPVVPLNDPTILFANAGMNQYKPIFLGQVDPASDMATWKRAANSQKCIRAGGKHNDLDDVGKDTYHHTFFEMLGNWSFGDYFKAEAIEFAWDLLTNVYGLDPDRIYATYFGGQGDLKPDDEARVLWKKYLPDSHILPFDMADNFWEMGEVGPCGPCTELHYDRIGGGRDAGPLVNMDDPNVIEIWNLVFMQFNRDKDGTLASLPAKHIDTGMGFERITSILQNKLSNYDTDVFTPLFAAIKLKTGTKHDYQGRLGQEDVGAVDTAYRVIADHIRTITFAITDGAQPGSKGREYVLRRVVRRAVRFGRQNLDAKPGFFAPLVDDVVAVMGDAFPELRTRPEFVKAIIAEEEELFGRTLDKGVKRFNKMKLEVTGEKKKVQHEIFGEVEWRVFPGVMAFQLLDTFGFPVDLTQMMAEEIEMTVDMEGFHKAMAIQQQNSKGKKGLADTLVLEAAETDALQKKGVPPTDDSSKYSYKVGGADLMSKEEATKLSGAEYIAAFGLEDKLEEMINMMLESKPADPYAAMADFFGKVADSSGAGSPTSPLRAIFSSEAADGRPGFVDTASADGMSIGLILEDTPFYAEAGGQIFDTGVLLADMPDGDDVIFEVTDCQKFGGYVLHKGVLKGGTLSLKMPLEIRVDYVRRSRIAPNHTCTHTLNYALRQVLGKDKNGKEVKIDQKGSLNDPEMLRFDFSFNKSLTTDQLGAVEKIAQEHVAQELNVYIEEVPLESAMKINTLRAVFGEKYPNPVRVVSIGQEIAPMLKDPENPKWLAHSVEFCAGTHVQSLAEAKAFVLCKEESISAGVRRIKGLTGQRAQQALKDGAALMAKLGQAGKKDGAELVAAVATLKEEVNAAKDISAFTRNTIREGLEELLTKIKANNKAAAGKLQEKAAAVLDAAVEAAGGAGLVVARLDMMGADGKATKKLVEKTQKKLGDKTCLFVFSCSDAKVLFMASVPGPMSKGFKAGDVVKAVMPTLGGKGGGSPKLAQGQGSKIAEVEAGTAAAIAFAKKGMKQPKLKVHKC